MKAGEAPPNCITLYQNPASALLGRCGAKRSPMETKIVEGHTSFERSLDG